jgi:hypothetical protein
VIVALVAAAAAVVIAAVAIVAIVAAHRTLSSQLEEQAREREEWVEERRSLLDRIQHPSVFQVPLPPLGEPGEPPVDESGLAGRVLSGVGSSPEPADVGPPR